MPQTHTWLDTNRPLSLKRLKGRIVLLDFWTYGCINCLHVLPDLKYLEQKYSDSLTVIGVHCAKFDHEQDTENIRQAILRYEIEHPVLVDREFEVWQQYAVRACPTFAVIDPQGYIVGFVSRAERCRSSIGWDSIAQVRIVIAPQQTESFFATRVAKMPRHFSKFLRRFLDWRLLK